MIDLETKKRLLGQRTWLVSVAGELDMHSAPDLERELRAALDGGAEVVIVDLAKCDFIDSTALGVLVSTRKELEPTGGRISLITSDSNIRRVFEITGFDRMFTIHATRAASIGATTNGGATSNGGATTNGDSPTRLASQSDRQAAREGAEAATE
jgi:anti-sigma B factor antagonist